jgi:hypothetical protein
MNAWDTKPEAHQEDVPTPRTDTQNVFLCRGQRAPADERCSAIMGHVIGHTAASSGWLYRNRWMLWLPMAPLAGFASLWGLSIGVGDIDLEAGGRFALTIFYLPVLWLISAAVVGGVCVGGLAICDKRGVRASRGLAVALAGAGVIEALLFGLAVMIGHNYAARAQSLRCRAAGRFIWVRTSAHQRKTFCVKAFGSVPRPSSVPA